MLLIVRVNFGLSLPPSLPPLPLSFLPCLPLRSSLPRHVNAIPCNLFNLPPFLPTLLLWHSFQCYVDFFFSSFLALSYLFHVFFFSLVCLDKYVFVSRSSFHFMLFNSQLSFAFWFSSSPFLSLVFLSLIIFYLLIFCIMFTFLFFPFFFFLALFSLSLHLCFLFLSSFFLLYFLLFLSDLFLLFSLAAILFFLSLSLSFLPFIS